MAAKNTIRITLGLCMVYVFIFALFRPLNYGSKSKMIASSESETELRPNFSTFSTDSSTTVETEKLAVSERTNVIECDFNSWFEKYPDIRSFTGTGNFTNHTCFSTS